MKLILVRHGETEENSNMIIQGHIPGKLTKRGLEQISKLALRLKDEPIDIIISSDLERAKRTAQEISKFHKAQMVFSKDVREKNYGIYEGMHVLKYKRIMKPGPEWQPEGGESYQQVRKRAIHFFHTIFPKYKGKNVVVVSHGGFNRQLLGFLLGKDVMASKEIIQNNTAVNIIEIKDDGNHKAKLINCTKHLANL